MIGRRRQRWEPAAPLSDFDASGANYRGFCMRWNSLSVRDVEAATGDSEGMIPDLRHVLVKHPSPVGEHRTYVRGDRNDLLGKFCDQADKERRRVFTRGGDDLGVDLLGDLFHSEEELIAYANGFVGEDDLIGGDLKAVRPPHQGFASEGRGGRSLADLAEPVAFETAMQRRASQPGHQTAEPFVAGVERKPSAPAVGEDDRFVLLSENLWARVLRTHRLIGRGLSPPPFSDRLATGAKPLRESGIAFRARLNRLSHFRGRRRTGMGSSSRSSARFLTHPSSPRIALQG